MQLGAIFISTLAARTIHQYPGQHSHQADMVENTIQPIVAFMVLCSITIHGLSIPGFSLGRRVHSVSRTWSRHGSRPGAPEWLNQARLISRGADIVINRDHDDQMERGESKSEEKDMHEMQQQDDAGSYGTTLEGQEQEDRPSHLSEEAMSDNPPDGTELIQEWQEPHHRIIESRATPGEDVRLVCVCD